MAIKIGCLIFGLLWGCDLSLAQTDANKIQPDMVFSVESMPQYPGGEAALIKFISNKINYDSLNKPLIYGIVYISCWVDSFGKTDSHQVLNGLRDDMNQEAIRVARLVRFEAPAKQRGKPIKVKYTIPVRFEPKKNRH